VLDLSSLLLAIVAGATIFYIRSAMLRAHQQKNSAIRFLGYLQNLRFRITDSEFFAIFYEGIKWNEDIKNILSSGGGVKELVELETKKKEIVKELKEEIFNAIDNGMDDIISGSKNYPRIVLPGMFDQIQRDRQNLIEGKIFISDEEAACLGPAVTSSSIQLKMDIVEALDAVTLVIFSFLEAPDKFNLRNYDPQMTTLLWKTVVVTKNIEFLTKICESISSMSIFQLTMRNLLE